MKNKNKKLTKFLLDNDCYNKFCVNLHNEAKSNIPKYCISVCERDLLYCAFNWNLSNENDAYWRIKNDKWYKEVLRIPVP